MNNCINPINMSTSNKVSASVSDIEFNKISDYIKEIEGMLPFLISLTNIERKGLRKMGSKSVEYVEMCYLGASEYPGYMRANFDIVEYGRDKDLAVVLQKILLKIQILHEKLSDTLMAVKSEAMVASD